MAKWEELNWFQKGMHIWQLNPEVPVDVDIGPTVHAIQEHLNKVSEVLLLMLPAAAGRLAVPLKGGLAAEGAAGAGAENVANAARLGKQLASEEGVAELMSGGGRVIAGPGTSSPIRDVSRLVSEHGGTAADWVKVTSTAPGHLQTHAYRNLVTGEVVELKSIVP